MKCAFVCWRPLQVFNSINFILHNYENSSGNSDLFLLNLEGNIKLLDEIKQSKLFNHIYIFNKPKWKNDILTRGNLLIDYLFPSRALLRDMDLNCSCDINDYDLLIASGYLPFFIHMTEVNKNARVVLLEDGMISYQGDERVLREKSFYNKVFHSIFKKGEMNVSVECLYLNNVSFKADYYPYRIEAMPYIDERVFKNLCKIFECSNFQNYNKKIIFLDQPLKAEPCVANVSEDDVISVLKNRVEDIILREHPNKNDIPTEFVQDTENVLWEIRSKEINENNVLIGYFSTAQLMPYIIYGNIPHLVFMYKIILDKDSLRYQSIDKLMKKLKIVYPGKIDIPESIEHLKSIIGLL